ncbi:MAG: biotin transporter BioY [Streptococcaceae bacterium]|jgi:biotin transport system substrate-specific component|nr:biotin transporter BioY [Streptococcaceae bacterium]
MSNDSFDLRRLTRIALIVAVIILLGLFPPITLGIIPVPIVLQNLGILLAGLLLGKKDGVFAVLLFYLLVAFGLPLLAGGRGGIAVFGQMTAGFLLGYLIAAFVIGFVVEKLPLNNQLIAALIATLIGVLIIDVLGGIYLGVYLKQSVIKALISATVYLPGDILKAIVASIVYRSMPQSLR